jgi:hypothetical protein
MIRRLLIVLITESSFSWSFMVVTSLNSCGFSSTQQNIILVECSSRGITLSFSGKVNEKDSQTSKCYIQETALLSVMLLIVTAIA